MQQMDTENCIIHMLLNSEKNKNDSQDNVLANTRTFQILIWKTISTNGADTLGLLYKLEVGN